MASSSVEPLLDGEEEDKPSRSNALCIFIAGIISLSAALFGMGMMPSVGGAHSYKELCDRTILEEVCIGGRITSTLLTEMLRAPKQELIDVWYEVNFTTVEHDDSGGYTIDCVSACSKLVTYIEKYAVLPPTSDVACYNIDGKTTCDIDVGLPNLVRQGPVGGQDLPDLHDEVFLKAQDNRKPADIALFSTEGAPLNLASDSKDWLNEDGDVDYGHFELIKRFCNVFRFYPIEKPSLAPPEPSAADWTREEHILHTKKMAEAQAYMNIVIRAFVFRQTQMEMTTWFGEAAYDSLSARKKVYDVLNGVDHMLNMVEPVYPGPLCSPNTYAYVYPRRYQCETVSHLKHYECTKYKDRLVFYLCPLYLKRKDEMIETLVHEGSHHAMSYTDDVMFKGHRAYGRKVCQELAIAAPEKALDNADNYCYYIQDTAEHLLVEG